MKDNIFRDVYKDASAHKNLPASVAIFLNTWVPFISRKIKRQRKEIIRLRALIDDIDRGGQKTP